MSHFLGIDIAKDTFDVVLMGDQTPPEHAQFENRRRGFNQFYRFLRKRHALTAHVCVEATGRYYESLADFLYEQDIAVSVINPARIQAYAASLLKRNKTDKVDAAVIADFCRTQQPNAPLMTILTNIPI